MKRERHVTGSTPRCTWGFVVVLGPMLIIVSGQGVSVFRHPVTKNASQEPWWVVEQVLLHEPSERTGAP